MADDEVAKLALECLKIKLETEKSENEALYELIGRIWRAVSDEWKKIKPLITKPERHELTELPSREQEALG